MGHTWLRVSMNSEVRDVCAGDTAVTPGQVNFQAVAPIWRGNGLLLTLTHAGMILFVGMLDWYHLLTRRQPPHWMYYRK